MFLSSPRGKNVSIFWFPESDQNNLIDQTSPNTHQNSCNLNKFSSQIRELATVYKIKENISYNLKALWKTQEIITMISQRKYQLVNKIVISKIVVPIFMILLMMMI